MNRTRHPMQAPAYGRDAFARACVAFALLAAVATPTPAHADEVDDAFTRGNSLAEQGQTQQAIAAYQQAANLLAQPSSLLSYNLGTSYAQLDDLGHATYHLQQALDYHGRPTAELAEAARTNLAVVRRRAELQAATTGAVIDRPETWWDVVVDALRAPAVGWTSVVAGFAALVLLLVDQIRRRRGRPIAFARTLILILAIAYLILGGLYGASLRADRTSPRAIVLGPKTEARVGPGGSRKLEFTIQGGSRVRILDRTPGWVLVQVPGGLEGWVEEQFIGELGHLPGRRSASPG